MKFIYFYSIFLFILNFILFKNYKFLSNLLNIYDFPDLKRKLHKTKISAAGGTILIIGIIFSFFLFKFINFNFFSRLEFTTFANSFFFFVLLIFFYLINFMDDKFNLSAITKVVFFSVLCYFIIKTNNLFLVQTLRFESFDKVLDLNNFSSFFSVLSIIIAVNAFNMYDGINLQSSTYFFILFAFFLFLDFSYFNLAIIFFLIFFIYYNNKNFIFLGNSGVCTLGLISSIMIIHNYNKYNFFVEDVLIFLLLPILDLIRLFFVRIKNNKNPMLGDRFHIHHLMIKKFGNYQTIFLLNSFFILLLFFKFILNVNFIIIFFISLIFYIFLIKS